MQEIKFYFKKCLVSQQKKEKENKIASCEAEDGREQEEEEEGTERSTEFHFTINHLFTHNNFHFHKNTKRYKRFGGPLLPSFDRLC